jgi:hypothetical protein
MQRRLLLFLAVAASLLVATAFGAGSARACDTSYWTVGCQFYSPSEGHTATKVCCSTFQSAYSTFDTFTTIKLILTTAGGRWLAADIVGNGGVDHFSSPNNDDKVGCFNHHTGTMWVNCRRYAGWGSP